MPPTCRIYEGQGPNVAEDRHILPTTTRRELGFVRVDLNPSRNAVPFWGQTIQSPTSLSPKNGTAVLKGFTRAVFSFIRYFPEFRYFFF